MSEPNRHDKAYLRPPTDATMEDGVHTDCCGCVECLKCELRRAANATLALRQATRDLAAARNDRDGANLLFDEITERLATSAKANRELTALSLQRSDTISGLTRDLAAVREERDEVDAERNEAQAHAALYEEALMKIRDRGYTGASFVAAECLRARAKGTNDE